MIKFKFYPIQCYLVYLLCLQLVRLARLLEKRRKKEEEEEEEERIVFAFSICILLRP